MVPFLKIRKLDQTGDNSVIKGDVLLYCELDLCSLPQFCVGFLEKADARLQRNFKIELGGEVFY